MINKIFPPINFPLTNIISIMRVSKPSTIPVNDDILGSCLVKTTFPSGETMFDFSYFLRTREGCKLTVMVSRFDYYRDNLYQESSSEIDT